MVIKNRAIKIKKIKKLLRKRNEILKEKTDIDSRLSQITDNIIKRMEDINVGAIKVKDQHFRKIQNIRTSYDIIGIEQLLSDKTNKINIDKVVKQTVSIKINESALIELIQEGIITIDDVKPYVKDIPSKPFIRSFNNAKA